MSEPLIVVTKIRIKDGELEGYRRLSAEIFRVVKEHEPRLIAFQVYLNEEGTEAASLQLHPDADSMEYHLQVLKEQISQASDFIEVTSFTVLGTPGAGLTGSIDYFREAGISVDHMPVHLNGVTRSSVE